MPVPHFAGSTTGANQSVAPEESVRTCPQCGTAVPNRTSVCAYCGVALASRQEASAGLDKPTQEASVGLNQPGVEQEGPEVLTQAGRLLVSLMELKLLQGHLRCRIRLRN